MNASDAIEVQLVCAWPERSHVHKARVPRGTTAGELLQHSRVMERFPEFAGAAHLAVFGRKIDPDYVLAPGDRVEVLRALLVDPKENRRRRAGQGQQPKPPRA